MSQITERPQNLDTATHSNGLSMQQLRSYAPAATNETINKTPPLTLRKKIQQFYGLLPGIILLALIAFAALIAQQLFGTPATLIALLVGFITKVIIDKINQNAHKTFISAGSNFTSSTILRLGIVLLGFRLTFDQILALGPVPILLSIGIVSLTLYFGFFLGRKLGLAPDFTIIASGATAICGASAALAIATAFPKSDTRENQTVFAIMVVTVMSSLAMLIYPLIAKASGFDATQAGLLFGATIHDVAQVVGAGMIYGDGAVETAAYSKMLRVALLAPVVIAIASVAHNFGGKHFNKQDCEGLLCTISSIMPPWFLLAFAVIVVINSLFPIPEMIILGAIFVSKISLLMALAAIAMKIEIRAIANAGLAPIILLVTNTLFVFTLAYVVIMFAF